jgi:hypothetical protein
MGINRACPWCLEVSCVRPAKHHSSSCHTFVTTTFSRQTLDPSGDNQNQQKQHAAAASKQNKYAAYTPLHRLGGFTAR